jgi:hypothetical protein
MMLRRLRRLRSADNAIDVRNKLVAGYGLFHLSLLGDDLAAELDPVPYLSSTTVPSSRRTPKTTSLKR